MGNQGESRIIKGNQGFDLVNIAAVIPPANPLLPLITCVLGRN